MEEEEEEEEDCRREEERGRLEMESLVGFWVLGTYLFWVRTKPLFDDRVDIIFSPSVRMREEEEREWQFRKLK